jgi:hypothetical protein
MYNRQQVSFLEVKQPGMALTIDLHLAPEFKKE